VLDRQCALILAKAMHVCSAPGRRRGVNGAMWIADLLAHGLIRSGFVTPARAATHDLRTQEVQRTPTRRSPPP
jgi:transposase